MAHAMLRVWLAVVLSFNILMVSSDQRIDDRLMDWLRERGTYEFNVKKPCPTCPRGAFAARDFKAKEIVARVKLDGPTSLPLGPIDGKEVAWNLLRRIHKDPNFNATFWMYMASLPSPEESFNVALFRKKDIELLQSYDLQFIANKTIEHYKKTYQKMREEDPSIAVSLKQYLYIQNIVSTRDFAFPLVPKGKKEPEDTMFLLPGLDMFNDGPPYNVERDEKDGYAEVKATRDIAEGEELRFPYWGERSRPDITLFEHGFIMDQEVPNLCLVDMGGFRNMNWWKGPDSYADILAGEAEKLYSSEDGPEEELGRLREILKKLATTEEEDRERLAIRQAYERRKRDWRTEIIYKFRIARKRAIRHRMDEIMKDLGSRRRPTKKSQKRRKGDSRAEEGRIDL